MNAPQTGFRFPEGEHLGSALTHLEGVPVLRVAGTAEQMGEAIGTLAVRNAPKMTDYADSILRQYRAGWVRPLLLFAGEKLVRNLPADHRAEFEAIARSAGIERARMVLGNTLFDIKKFFACSALLVEPDRSASGQTMLGRNLDYPSQGFAHEYSLVTVYRPAGRKAFVSVGFPGLVGALSGMNESGLCLGVLEVFQSRWFTGRLNLNGVPYAVCFRTLLETCETIDEARRALQKMRRTTLFNLAIADRQRVAVLEVTPRRVRERSADGGACLCTNHFQLAENLPLLPLNVYKTFERHRLLQRANRATDRFDLDDVHAGLHAANQGDHTLQTMIFEPSALRMHVWLGSMPSTAGPRRTLELAGLLRGR